MFYLDRDFSTGFVRLILWFFFSDELIESRLRFNISMVCLGRDFSAGLFVGLYGSYHVVFFEKDPG